MESLGINLEQIIFQLINFSLLLALLNKFLYKPVLEYVRTQRELDQKYRVLEQEIKNQKEQYEFLSEEQKKELRAMYEESLEKARREARKIVDEAKENARQEGVRILKEYNEEAKQVHESMISSAGQEIYDSAVKIAQTIMATSLTDEQRKLLMNLALEKLDHDAEK